jgi:hypothetical protein
MCCAPDIPVTKESLRINSGTILTDFRHAFARFLVARFPRERLVAVISRVPGTGAGTFAAIMPIYRDVDDPVTSTAPAAAATLSIELCRPTRWLILIEIVGAIVSCSELRCSADAILSSANLCAWPPHTSQRLHR